MLSADWNDYCFIDTETRARPGTSDHDGDVTECGAYRYMQTAAPIMVQYAIGDGPVRVVAKDDWGGDPMNGYLTAADLPDDLRAFQSRALQGGKWFVAHNAAFDRVAMNALHEGCMPIDIMIDNMVQCAVANLPLGLEGASRAIGRGGKVQSGKHLINVFCRADGSLPEDRPEDWQDFRGYGAADIEELRAVFQGTNQLSRMEWEEYWASEEINDRGVPIDLPFVRNAARLAEVSRIHINQQIAALTGGGVDKVTQIARIVRYVAEHCTLPLVTEYMTKTFDEDEETGEVDANLGLDRGQIERILAYMDTEDEKRGLTDIDWRLYQLLDLRLYGGSATMGKFGKMLGSEVGGRVQGQYVLNGAAQTGRFSARGVQFHNLTRNSLYENEAVAIDMITEAV